MQLLFTLLIVIPEIVTAQLAYSQPQSQMPKQGIQNTFASYSKTEHQITLLIRKLRLSVYSEESRTNTFLSYTHKNTLIVNYGYILGKITKAEELKSAEYQLNSGKKHISLFWFGKLFSFKTEPSFWPSGSIRDVLLLVFILLDSVRNQTLLNHIDYTGYRMDAHCLFHFISKATQFKRDSWQCTIAKFSHMELALY